MDSPEIRAALLHAADDPDVDTRDEALVGLARRDKAAAIGRLLPLLADDLGIVLLEAAEIIGDRALLPALREIQHWEGGDEQVREQLNRAIAACEAGVGQDPTRG